MSAYVLGKPSICMKRVKMHKLRSAVCAARHRLRATVLGIELWLGLVVDVTGNDLCELGFQLALSVYCLIVASPYLSVNHIRSHSGQGIIKSYDGSSTHRYIKIYIESNHTNL